MVAAFHSMAVVLHAFQTERKSFAAYLGIILDPSTVAAFYAVDLHLAPGAAKQLVVVLE